MKKNVYMKHFILTQLRFSALVVVLCAVISTLMSYGVLQGRLTDWLVSNNTAVLKSITNLTDELVIRNAEALYLRLAPEFQTLPEKVTTTMGYYSENALQSDILSTTKVRDTLSNIKNSNDYISRIELLYPENHLLISDSSIVYDLFRPERLEQISDRMAWATEIAKSDVTTRFLYDTTEDEIVLYRPIARGRKVMAIVIFYYDTALLRDYFASVLPSESVNVVIMSETDELLFAFDADYARESLPSSAAFTAREQDTGYMIEPHGGTDSIVSYSYVEKDGLVYLSVAQKASVLRSASDIYVALLWSLGISFVIALLFIFLYSVWYNRPILSIVQLLNFQGSRKKGRLLDEMLRSVGKIRDLLDTQEMEIRAVTSQLRENFVLWLLSEQPTDRKAVEDYLTPLRIEFLHENFYLLCAEPDIRHVDGDDEVRAYERDYALSNAFLLLQNIFNTNANIGIFHKQDLRILGLINTKLDEGEMQTLLTGIFSGELHGFHFYAAVSGRCASAPEASILVRELIRAKKLGFLQPDRCLFSVRELEGRLEYIEPEMTACVDAFSRLLADRRPDDAATQLADIIAILQEQYTAPAAKQVMLTLAAEIEKQLDAGSTLMLRLKSCGDILAFGDVLSDALGAANVPVGERSDTTEYLIRQTRAYVDANFLDPQLTLTNAAGALNVSPSYLSRTFKKYEGMSFVAYLSKVKMEYACRQLRESNASVAELAEALGYASSQYFVTVFKKQYGMTPSAYRKENRR